jgi:hypothetical protein
MQRLVALAAGVLALFGVARAEPPRDAPKDDQPPMPVIRPLVRAEKTLPRAFKYALLPDAADVQPGNAAQTWLRAGRAAVTSHRQIFSKGTEKEDRWLSKEVPLKDLPVKEMQQFVEDNKEIYRLADDAARREYCEWDLPPLTVQTLESLPLSDIQSFRAIAAYLSVRSRLALAEGKFDQAVANVQTGLMLARHVARGKTLIHDLVAIALAHIAFGWVDEMLETPGCPNLYWALTALPSPFIDLRASLQYELDTVYRSFPVLRRLDREKFSEEEANRLGEEFLQTILKYADKDWTTEWQGKLTLAAIVGMSHEKAKKALVAGGRPAEEVDKLPAAQAVGLYFLNQYNDDRDELLEAFSLQPWQAVPRLEAFDKRLKEQQKKQADKRTLEASWVMLLLGPAALKVHDAGTRAERTIAALRTVEAIRLYAATHDGKLPKTLGDVTDVPLPVDPRTGKGFDGYYKATDDGAVLEVPPPPGMPPVTGKKFEFTRAKP